MIWLSLTVWVTYMAMLVQFVCVVSLIRKALCNSATLRNLLGKLGMIWDLKMHCSYILWWVSVKDCSNWAIVQQWKLLTWIAPTSDQQLHKPSGIGIMWVVEGNLNRWAILVVSPKEQMISCLEDNQSLNPWGFGELYEFTVCSPCPWCWMLKSPKFDQNTF
jgi:hypothetical protein